MFVDESLEAISLASSWNVKKTHTENGMQTAPVKRRDVGLQSIKTKDHESQTEGAEAKEIQLAQDDSPALAAFLKQAEPIVTSELQKNSRSHAFDGYEFSTKDTAASVQTVYTLTNIAFQNQLAITNCSWNSTGSVVAAAYGNFDHEDWCTHKSALCTWNIDRSGINTTKPDVVFDVTCCLMTVAFHPKIPSLIAGGNFNGEVTVWDLSHEDDLMVATSGIGDNSHREPVSKVYWLRDDKIVHKDVYELWSVSGDGKILVWSLPRKGEDLKLIKGFCILAESLPRYMRSMRTKRDAEVGVTCISSVTGDSTTFFVGSEPGVIFKCNTEAKGTPAPKETMPSPVPLHSPVTFAYHPHNGPVYSVDCSHFHRNLFLTTSSDQTVRLYNMLETKPILSIEPGSNPGYLFSAHWSPFRPLVFAASTASGKLLIYDLKHSRATPVQQLDASPQNKPVYTMAFNPEQRSLIATGDGDGWLQIYQLSDELTSPVPSEEELLAALVTEIGTNTD